MQLIVHFVPKEGAKNIIGPGAQMFNEALLPKRLRSEKKRGNSVMNSFKDHLDDIYSVLKERNENNE